MTGLSRGRGRGAQPDGYLAPQPRTPEERRRARHIDCAYWVAEIFSDLGYQRVAEAWLVEEVARCQAN